MGFWNKFKNLISGEDPPSVDAASQQLLEWLGVDTNDVKAINEATYYTCLKVLSETIGKLPLKCYRREDGGRVQQSPGHGADILMNRPNPYMTPATFWSLVEGNCEHYGNSYVWIQRAYLRSGAYGGSYEITGFYPMRPDCVQVLMDDAGIFGGTGNLYYQYTDPKSAKQYVFQSSDVLHFKTWLTWDGVMGKSVRDILKSTIRSEASSQKYLEELYDGGLSAASVLQYTGDLDKQRRDRLAKEYNALLTGAKNAGKVVPLPVGMTLQPLSYKLTDAQFYELKKYTALQIAAAFGVKPVQINDYTKSSYASAEHQQLSFLVDTMLFRLSQIEQEINYKVLTDEERTQEYYFKFNEKVILRADSQTQMQTLANAVQNGIYTDNEARAMLDLPAMEGGGQLIVNGNYVPLTSVGAAYGVSTEGDE